MGEMEQLDPNKVAKVKQVSSQITAEIRIEYQENKISLQLNPSSPDAEGFVSNFLPNFATIMASQLGSCFGINGEIIDVGKPN